SRRRRPQRRSRRLPSIGAGAPVPDAVERGVWVRMRLSGWSVVAVAAALVFGLAGPAGAQSANDPLAGSPRLGGPYYPLDGNGGYDVRHYEVGIGYEPISRQLTGSPRIDATATQALTAFNLDFAGPPVQRVTVNNIPAG